LLIHFVRLMNARNMEHIKISLYVFNCWLLFISGSYKPNGTLKLRPELHEKEIYHCVFFLKEVIPVVCVQLDIVGRDRQTQLSVGNNI
jgi:hypothetical protein